jgi:xanthine dehydrogenase iron-sulfur cluster and FAD-binding subunit A
MWKQHINVNSLDQAIDLLDRYQDSGRIIAGGTDLILEIERGLRKNVECLIDISRLSELDKIELDNNGVLHIGALVTHNQCLSNALTRKYAQPLVEACWQVGSPQIRNRATIAGNLITASPANDTITPLMALGASIGLKSKRGVRYIKLSEFYTGVRRTAMKQDEILVDIAFPALTSTHFAEFYKYGLRNAQAISIVNACTIVKMDRETVSEAVITLGSVAPTIIHSEKAEKYLTGKKLTPAVISETAQLAIDDSHPIDDIRATAVFRKYLVKICVKKTLASIKHHLPERIVPEYPILLDTSQINTSFSGDDLDAIRTRINGKDYYFNNSRGKTLLQLIREDAGLTGTKEGCAEGECGACTVFMDGKAVMSCLVPAGRAHQANIITIEGLAIGGELNAVQQGFVNKGAVQCGYCTPGMIMSATKLLEEKSQPSNDEIRHALAGNLCRCTGYYQIMEAVESAIAR